jgi:uncharacterized membrane protein YwzB
MSSKQVEHSKASLMLLLIFLLHKALWNFVISYLEYILQLLTPTPEQLTNT